MTGGGSARAAERPLRRVNQGAQGRIDGLLVREILSDIRGEQHEIRSCAIARDILAADPARGPRLSIWTDRTPGAARHAVLVSQFFSSSYFRSGLPISFF